MINPLNIISNNTNYVHLYFFYSTYVSKGIHISIELHKYLVPTGLKIDRHVFTVICPFL